MDNTIIPITALPQLTDNIKRAIGLSLWSLIKIKSEVAEARYLLKTPEQSFLLDHEGGVIKVLENCDNVTEICRVYFQGYNFPSDVKLNSISNTVCK